MSIASPEHRHRIRREEQEQQADAISAALRAVLLEHVDRGEELTSLGDAEEVAARLVDRLPLAANPWAEIVGPCYTSGSLQRELGISRAGLSKAVSDGRLLRLVTADGRNVYPAFQVVDGALVRGLREVLNALRQGVDDPWTWAQWLNTPVPDRSAGDEAGAVRLRRQIERLASGDIECVVRDAEHTAVSWAA